MRPVTFIASICSLGIPLPMPAQTPARATGDDEKLIAYLINGWKAEREKLAAGKVEISGLYRTTDPDSKPTTPLFALQVFNNFRNVSRGYTDWQGPPCWWLVAPDREVVCENASLAVMGIMSPDAQGRVNSIELDPRCVGACDINAFFFGGLSFRRTVTFWENTIKNYTCKVARCGDGVYEIEGSRILENTGLRRFRIVINESRGFSFEKLEFARKETQDNPKERWAMRSAECRWSAINEVWVPIKFKSQGEFNEDSIEFDLKWHQVGGHFGDEEFTVENLGVPKGTTVVDYRLGEGIIIGHTQGSHDPPPVMVSDAGPLSPRTIGILVANIMLLAVIGAAYLWRKNRKAKTTGS